MIKGVERLSTLLNGAIESQKYGEHPIELYEPLSYIMSLGGKRLRPLLVLMAYGLYKEDVEKIIDQALAIEVFHNFTLMHDDIMDQAPLRRGKPTVHEKWDTNTAILSGDVMLVKAYDLLTKAEVNKLPDIIRLFNKGASEVCEGQQLDMMFEERDSVTEEEYLEMIRLKTAVLLGMSLQLGALMAGADKESQEAVCEFGVNIGIGFQLKDDLLDVYADQKNFGKQVGGDIIANKKTFLLIKALENADKGQLKSLRQWLSKTEFDNQQKVEAVTAIYDELKIKEITETKMNEYFDQGFKALKKLDVSLPQKAMLKSFAEKLIDRVS